MSQNPTSLTHCDTVNNIPDKTFYQAILQQCTLQIVKVPVCRTKPMTQCLICLFIVMKDSVHTKYEIIFSNFLSLVLACLYNHYFYHDFAVYT